MSQLPPQFKPLRPGQRQLSASGMNDLQQAARDFLRLHFDPRHFLRQGNTVTLRGKKTRQPFELYQTAPLKVKIEPGKVIHWGNPNVIGDHQPQLYDVYSDASTETDPEFTVTNGTTYIYLTVHLELHTSTETAHWILHTDPGTASDSPLELSAATSIPTQDWRQGVFFEAATMGSAPTDKLYIPIGTIIAASGKITSVTNTWTGILPISYNASAPKVLLTATKGDIIYAVDDNPENWSRLAIGTENQVLTVNASGLPEWKGTTDVDVVTAVRDNAGTIEVKTTPITVIAKGTESGWT